MNERVGAATASVSLSAFGVLAGGMTGIAFLLTPVEIPLWFVLAVVALPTGDVLGVVREVINARKRKVKQE